MPFLFDDQNVGKEHILKIFSFEIPYIGWDQTEKVMLMLNLILKWWLFGV
jgi:hypothetical protein